MWVSGQRGSPPYNGEDGARPKGCFTQHCAEEGGQTPTGIDWVSGKESLDKAEPIGSGGLGPGRGGWARWQRGLLELPDVLEMFCV